MTIKNFKARTVATLTTGITLVDRFEGVQEAYSHVIGHEVFTHEMASREQGERVKNAILAQRPDMPVEVPNGDYKTLMVDLDARYPNGVDLESGSTPRTEHPVASAVRIMDARQ